jgi:hypothetical protein
MARSQQNHNHKREAPPCWADGTCDSPIRCYLDGCKKTGYVSPGSSPEEREANVFGRVPRLGSAGPIGGSA